MNIILLLKHKKNQCGLTLVELLIALVVGIVVVGIVFFGFRANQISYENKIELDTAHEAARFAQYTIGRIVRNASELDLSNGELLVSFDSEPGVRNCLGVETGGPDSFGLTAGGVLYCNNPANQLVEGILSIGFDPFSLNPADGTVDETVSWGDADGVLVSMDLVGGRSVSFVATMRNKILSYQ